MNPRITLKFPREALHGKTIRFSFTAGKNKEDETITVSGTGKLMVFKSVEASKFEAYVSTEVWPAGETGEVKVTHVYLPQEAADFIRILPKGESSELECVDPRLSAF